jgi:hypothetical protein
VKVVRGYFCFGGNDESLNRETVICSLVGEIALSPGTPYRSDIVSIDLCDVAVSNVEVDCLGTTFTGFLSLTKHGN